MRRATIWVATAVLLAGCSPDISGDVFFAMQSGDVKRAAGIEVLLLQDDAAFQSEWSSVLTDGRESFAKWSASQPTTYEEVQRGLDALSRFHQRVRTTALSHTIRTTRTDVNGHYEFRGISRGVYRVFAEHSVFDNHPMWLVPAKVGWIGTVRIDLSNGNQGIAR